MVVVVVVPFSLSLENENKTSVIQAILFHDTIGRMKAALDQLRDGLSCLGCLEKMNKFPALFEELFVFKGSSLTSQAVVSRLKFSSSIDDEKKTVNDFLTEFLLASSQDTLKMFLTFVTGASCLPYFGLQTLSVKLSNHLSI